MATLGSTGVSITLEEFAEALEKAAARGIDAGVCGTAVELTAKGIAGMVLLETVATPKQPMHPPGVRGEVEDRAAWRG